MKIRKLRKRSVTGHRHKNFPISRRQFLGLSFSLALCLFLYAKLIEPNWIDVHRVPLRLPHLASEFDGYRIVQISDLHTDKLMRERRLRGIFRLVTQQKPDLIAMTGDFVTEYQQKFIPNFQRSLKELKPKDKTVAVLGNHDHLANPQAIRKALVANDIIDLNNSVYTIKRGNAIFNIAGVDDVLLGKPRLDLVLQQLPSEGAAVILAHEPDFADTSAATGKFDLQLSGHSHAGQVRLPFLKPPTLPTLGKKYYEGLNRVGNMNIYTNRGVGMTGLHIRFGSRPEITVFDLVAGGAG